MEENGSINGGVTTRRLHSSIFRRVRPLLVLVCVLFGSLALILPVHADTYIGLGAGDFPGATCPSQCQQSANPVADGTGSAIQAPFAGKVTGVSLAAAQNPPTKVVIATMTAGSTPTFVGCGSACGGGFDMSAGNSFTVQDVETISPTGSSTGVFSAITLANPISVASGQWVAVVFIAAGASQFFLMACTDSSPGCAGPGSSTYLAGADISFGSNNPAVGSTFQSILASGTFVSGATFTPAGTTGPVLTTRCFGNCGTPPITLVNTNSTHTVNFNQSVTLFYEFQSTLNGFLVNVTTNIGKNYNNGQSVVLGVYTIASCPLGSTPFSGGCPGILQTGQNSFLTNPIKGRDSFGTSNLLTAVFNGQWVGIAVSASFSGLDLNDTNASVQLFQTNGGPNLPPVISQSSMFGAPSKMGLWAWIVGNVITAAPPQTVPGGCVSFAGIDCLFPALVNSFCTSFTASCQTSSALFWVVILSLFMMFVLQFGVVRLLPGSKFVAGGEIFILIFVSFIVMFTGLGLLPVYVPILIFFIASLLMSKRVSSYV